MDVSTCFQQINLSDYLITSLIISMIGYDAKEGRVNSLI